MARLGEGVNSATQRLMALLQKNAVAMKISALKTGDEELRSAAKLIHSLRQEISDSKPIQLLQFRCGFSMVTTLYVIPVFIIVRINELCRVHQEMCFGVYF